MTWDLAHLGNRSAGAGGRLAAVVAVLDRVPPSLFHLLFRIAIASVFLKAGLIKIGSWEQTLFLLTRGAGALSLDRLIGAWLRVPSEV